MQHFFINGKLLRLTVQRVKTVVDIHVCVCFSVSLNHKHVGQLSSWKQNVANIVAV